MQKVKFSMLLPSNEVDALRELIKSNNVLDFIQQFSTSLIESIDNGESLYEEYVPIAVEVSFGKKRVSKSFEVKFLNKESQ